MYRRRALLALLLLVCGIASGEEAGPRATVRHRLSFLGVTRSQEAVPLLVLLGDRADTPPTVAGVLGSERMRAYHPLYVLAIQAEGIAEQPTVRTVRSTIERVRDAYDVDPARVYLVGEGSGADLIWRLLESFPLDYAAAVPANGQGAPRLVERFAEVPMWIFHDADDERVPVDVARATVGALWAAGADVRYTEYRDQETDRWAALRREDRLLFWLFMQRREQGRVNR